MEERWTATRCPSMSLSIVAAVGVPVTADLEAGYGDTPDDVGRTVARAVESGAVGANIEDAGKTGLFGIDEAVDRIAAAGLRRRPARSC